MKAKVDRPSFDDASLAYVRLYRSLGLLPFSGRGFGFLGTRLLVGVGLFSSVLIWTTYVCYCFTISKVEVDAICETVVIVGMSVRYYVMLWKRERLLEMVDDCRAIWGSCDADGRRTVLGFERKMRRLVQFYFSSALLINVMYPVDAAVNRLPLPDRQSNVTLYYRRMPFKWYVMNAADHWPGYWPSFALQLFAMQVVIVIGTACDTACSVFMMICSGFFRHLGDRLYASADLADDDKFADAELVGCVSFHQQLIVFCRKLDEFGRTILLTELLNTGYNVALIAIKLTGSDPDKLKYLPVLTANICQLYLCQWAPNHLYEESEAISTAAYFASVKWLRRRLGKTLLLVITKAQQPVQMTAGGIVKLSLENFGSMMASIFSFFTVLRKLNL